MKPKKCNLILTTLVACQIACVSVVSQVPDQFSYQAVIRDAANNLVIGQNVGFRISILQDSISGTVIYNETQLVATDAIGLLTTEIGGWTGFDTISWSQGPYFIRTEIDPAGGTDYTIVGTSPLLSVPYALHAKTANSLVAGITENDPLFTASLASGITAVDTARWNNKLSHESQDIAAVLAQSSDANGLQIKNIADPTDPGDASTKAYVDNLRTRMQDLEELLIDAGLFQIKDADGNSYHVVKLGDQAWMGENLKTTHYNDGSAITLSGYDERCGFENSLAYFWQPENETSYKDIYGALYSLAMMQSGKICPVGWHVPAKSEWDQLTAFLGGSSTAGGRMKETGTTHWISPNTGADNSNNFTGLPGGWLNSCIRGMGGGLEGKGLSASWWSSTSISGDSYHRYTLSTSNTALNRESSRSIEGSSVRCIKNEDLTKAKLPTLTTKEITGIYQNLAISGGVIVSNGGSAITEKGVCWSTEPTPTLYHRFTSDEYDSGMLFTSQLTVLAPNTTYYVRAYAKNSKGIAYGNERVFTTKEELPYGSISDVEGNLYKTIVIGSQTWMAENLKAIRYSNGDLINEEDTVGGVSGFDYQTAFYGNENYVPEYGRLYSWYVVDDYRNVCPSGWHVPGETEWDTLAVFLGGNEAAGNKMKDARKGYWTYKELIITNESGFSALPGGYKGDYDFLDFGRIASWWSRTSFNSDDAYFRDLWYETTKLYSFNRGKDNRLSVRCLKD